MAISVPSPQAAATKWVSRAQNATADYKTAVQGAGQRWQEATSAAGPLWVQGVQNAVANGRFESNVAGKANDYQTMASTKGATNYGGGITSGQGKYSNKIAKVLNVIQGATLPPPGPRNSPQQYARSQYIGNLLNAAKMQGQFN